MSKKDTDKDQPVESIEDEVNKAIAELEPEETKEEIEDNPDDTEEAEESESDTVSDESEPEQDDQDSESDAESVAAEGEEANDEDQEPDVEEDKLEAPEHWATADKELFSNQSKESQDFLLKRHKDMEGDYTRKTQAFAQDKRRYDAINDALAPFEQEFAQAGLDQAGAVRQLASWHNSLKTGGKAAVMQLAQMYQIDMAESEDQEYTDPQVQVIQKEMADLKNQQARNTQAAQQDKQKQLYDVIQSFEGEKGADGALMHPHFETLKDDITRLFQAGIASDLSDGYNKALSMRPDLAVVKQPAKAEPSKSDQAAKVKKAKKAATGVKSSGAVGKINRKEMTLEQEVASHFQ